MRKSLGMQAPPLLAWASDSWQIAAAETVVENPTWALPGQFERVQQLSEFSLSMAAEQASLRGGQPLVHAATRAHLLRDVMLIDGVLYRDASAQSLHRRTRLPGFATLVEVSQRAAMVCSYGGNMYFGTWLMDDCVTFALAQSLATPVTTQFPRRSKHMSQYVQKLALQSQPLDNVFFRELLLFEDLGQNQHKRARAHALSTKLTEGLEVRPHAGVFMLRGASGARRMLVNEQQLAEHAHQAYGLRLVDPTQLSVSEIVAACAGARMVVGVEGSQLLHGMLHLQPGGSLLALQPPSRYCSLLKGLTERDGQKFGVLVGTPSAHSDAFTMDVTELDQTMALLMAAPCPVL